MSDDFSQLGPDVADFASERPAPGYVRMKIQNVREFWESSCWAGELCRHMRDRVTGETVVDVPAAHAHAMAKAGYILLEA